MDFVGDSVLNGNDWPGFSAIQTTGSTVVLDGSGKLTANGGYNSAGIGGTAGNAGGTVVINNGEVTANGIGGGGNGDGGTVTINGGIVNTLGSYDSAGIGGGQNGNGGSLTINGGSVYAQGRDGGAGIGGGSYGNGGTVTINGGMVNAVQGSRGGASIGGGNQGAGGTVTINGGSVVAASIGAGQNYEGPNHGSLKNSAGDDVFLNSFQIGRQPVSNTAITSGSISDVLCDDNPNDGISGFGIKDVQTDNSGRVNFFLPATKDQSALEAVSLLVNGNLYHKAVAINNRHDNFAILELEDQAVAPSIWASAAGNQLTVNQGAANNNTIVLAATGTPSPHLKVTLKDGSPLPAWLTYKNGMISARPGAQTAAGAYLITASAQNYWGNASIDLTINVVAMPQFAVTIADNIYAGSITSNTAVAVAAETVTLTASPANSDYELKTIRAVYNGSQELTLTADQANANIWSFEMPEYPVTINATFGMSAKATALASLKAAIENGDYDTYQAFVSSSDFASDLVYFKTNNIYQAYKDYYEYTLGIGYPIWFEDISLGSDFVPALAGTAQNPAGTDGSFSFKVVLGSQKYNAETGYWDYISTTTDTITVKIKATPYLESGTAPAVVRVTPTGTGNSTSGSIIILFNKEMDTGTYQLTLTTGEGSDYLYGGWVNNSVFMANYNGLSLDTEYTIELEGFIDGDGTALGTDQTGYKFSTVAGPPTIQGAESVTDSIELNYGYSQFDKTYQIAASSVAVTVLDSANSVGATFSNSTLTIPPGLAVGRYSCIVTVADITGNATLNLTVVVKKVNISITVSPTAKLYVGQKLSASTLVGGAASVPGSFAWTDANQTVNSSGDYQAIFIPTDTSYQNANVIVNVQVLDRSALDAKITAATDIKNAAVLGSGPGQYSQEAVDGLNSAIQVATTLRNSPAATNSQAAIDAAVIALTDALDSFSSYTGSSVDTDWTRLGGANRYATMAKIVAQGFTDPGAVDTAIVAFGGNFPDALTAASLAGVTSAPIITTDTATLTPEAKTQLDRLKPANVIIVGAEPSVSKNVYNTIDGLSYVTNVKRLGGKNRLETAQMIYAEGSSRGTLGNKAIITVSDNYPDALSVSPVATAERYPIFLADRTAGLDAATVNAIKDGNFEQIVILGDNNSVPDKVISQLASKYSPDKIIRKGGKSRFETSQIIADWSVATSSKLGYNYLVTTTGLNYPDALVAGAWCGQSGGNVLVMVAENSVWKGGEHALANLIALHKDQIQHGYILGDTKAISNGFATRIQNASK